MVIKGSKREAKETWWWNKKVQKAIKEKKERFRRMHLDRSTDNVERYKMTKKTEKLTVSEVRDRMYDGLYQRLDTKGRRTFIGWPKTERGRRRTSSKLNALRMRQSDS
jgi:hypothetical protein